MNCSQEPCSSAMPDLLRFKLPSHTCNNYQKKENELN